MQLSKPEWLKISSQAVGNNSMVELLLKSKGLNSVCQEANCPNINECFSKKTVTFMILGNVCTRNCRFCSVTKGVPTHSEKDEGTRILQAINELGLKYVVITSVTRDDLPDGGASSFVDVIRTIKEEKSDVFVEVLIPDFLGNVSALELVINEKPDVLNHNIETVPRLYGSVRPMAIYERSIELLKNVKRYNTNTYTKSGIMVGFGETEKEVIEVFEDLRSASCDFLTIGQYLSPSKSHHEVVEYIHPDIFEKYKKVAYSMGFKNVEAGPFVRSSYHAGDAIGYGINKS